MIVVRAQQLDKRVSSNQMTRDKGRDCFRNKRLPNVRFVSLWGLRFGDDMIRRGYGARWVEY